MYVYMCMYVCMYVCMYELKTLSVCMYAFNFMYVMEYLYHNVCMYYAQFRQHNTIASGSKRCNPDPASDRGVSNAASHPGRETHSGEYTIHCMYIRVIDVCIFCMYVYTVCIQIQVCMYCMYAFI